MNTMTFSILNAAVMDAPSAKIGMNLVHAHCHGRRFRGDEYFRWVTACDGGLAVTDHVSP